MIERKKIKQNAFAVYEETAKDDEFFKSSVKNFSDLIVSSFQGIGQVPNERFDVDKKLDKCIQKLD